MQRISNVEELRVRLKELSEMTSVQLAEVVRNGDYIVSQGFYFDYENIPKLADGWTIIVTRPAPSKKPRFIFITATDENNRAIWNEGQKVYIANSGLPNDIQQAWLDSTHRSKFILLEHIVKLSYSRDTAKKYLNYRLEFTGAEYSAWAKESGIEDRLSPRKRADLVELIKEFKLA